MPAPTPSPKKIYKFGVLGGKDDIDNSIYMSQGHSLLEGKSGAALNHPVGTAYKFGDRDDKDSNE